MFSFIRKTYVASFDYKATRVGELSFNKGHSLKLIEKISKNWWMLENVYTGMRGIAPSSYVAKVDSVEAQNCYFKEFTRKDAEDYLLSEVQENGRYLIRNPDTFAYQHRYSLTILLRTTSGDEFMFKHYRIYKNRQGKLYIRIENQFPSIKSLLNFYHTSLCMTEPCQRTEPPKTGEWDFDYNDANRSVLGSTYKAMKNVVKKGQSIIEQSGIPKYMRKISEYLVKVI